MSKRINQQRTGKLSTDSKQRVNDERINAEDKQNYQQGRTEAERIEPQPQEALDAVQERRDDKAGS